MKLTIEDDGATWLLRAETPQDLDYLERMKGVHEPGPWRWAEFIKVPVAELGFNHHMHGTLYMANMARDGDDCGISGAMAAVKLRTDWLVYGEPPTAAAKLRSDAALGVGYSLLKLVELAHAQAHVGNDAACVR